MIVAGPVSQKMAPVAPPDLRPDARAQVGHRHGRLRQLRRHVQQLRDRPGRRPHRPGRHLRARLPAAPRDADRRDPQAARPDPGQQARRQPHRRGSREPRRPPCAPCPPRRCLPPTTTSRTSRRPPGRTCSHERREEGRRHPGPADPRQGDRLGRDPHRRRPALPRRRAHGGRRAPARPEPRGHRAGADRRAARHVRRHRRPGHLAATAASSPRRCSRAPASGPTAADFDDVADALERALGESVGYDTAVEQVVVDRGEITLLRPPRATCWPWPRCCATTPTLRFELCIGRLRGALPRRRRAASCTPSTTCSR